MSLKIEPGALFAGDFRIVRRLAAGGMGAVYVVDQVSTGKPRALKLMHPQLVSNAQLRERFVREARIGARIESSHVVEVLTAGVDDATAAPYLVMELLEGRDLSKLVAERGRLPGAEAAAIFEQLGHAMTAAHRAGVVHRDLKPENVFIARSRRADEPFTVKLLDLGIAKWIAEGRADATDAVGSPLWLAPEQTERQDVGLETDVWAIGLLAFYVLTGHVFWRAADVEHPTITQILKEILMDPISTASGRAGEKGMSVPLGFDAWFARCVNRDRRARFRDAGEAFAALAALPSVEPKQAATPAEAPRPRLPRGVIVGGVALLVVALTAGILAVVRHRAPSPADPRSSSELLPASAALVRKSEHIKLTAYVTSGRADLDRFDQTLTEVLGAYRAVAPSNVDVETRDISDENARKAAAQDGLEEITFGAASGAAKSGYLGVDVVVGPERRAVSLRPTDDRTTIERAISTSIAAMHEQLAGTKHRVGFFGALEAGFDTELLPASAKGTERTTTRVSMERNYPEFAFEATSLTSDLDDALTGLVVTGLRTDLTSIQVDRIVAFLRSGHAVAIFSGLDPTTSKAASHGLELVLLPFGVSLGNEHLTATDGNFSLAHEGVPNAGEPTPFLRTSDLEPRSVPFFRVPETTLPYASAVRCASPQCREIAWMKKHDGAREPVAVELTGAVKLVVVGSAAFATNPFVNAHASDSDAVRFVRDVLQGQLRIVANVLAWMANPDLYELGSTTGQ